MSEKATVEVFEWEILDLIRSEDKRLWNPSDGAYFLRYNRARYEEARGRVIKLKKVALLEQGEEESNIRIPNENSPNPVPAWGWE